MVRKRPTRKAHIVWLFESYVTGEHLIRELAETLSERGLRTRPTTKFPEGTSVTMSMVERMLANPYYAGVVVFEGVRYQGRHELLVSMELFEEVSALKHSRRLSKEKPYQHPHYLKGTVACGQCGERLGVTKTKNRHGTVYPYFYCLGRQKHRSDCTQTYVSMDVVEDRVAELWKSVVLPADVRQALRRAVLDLAERTQSEQTAEIGRQTARLARLDSEREKLLQAHYAEAVPLDLLKREQARIGREMATAQEALSRLNTELGAVERGLDQALALVADCHQLYLSAPPHVRRQLNQAVFEQIFVEDGEVPTGKLASPFGELLALVEQTEPQEWGSEDQLKRYLRSAPMESTGIREIEDTIARILAENEERAVLMDSPGKSKNPGPTLLGQGSNVALMVERGGFEPPSDHKARNGFRDRRTARREGDCHAVLAVQRGAVLQSVLQSGGRMGATGRRMFLPTPRLAPFLEALASSAPAPRIEAPVAVRRGPGG